MYINLKKKLKNYFAFICYVLYIIKIISYILLQLSSILSDILIYYIYRVALIAGYVYCIIGCSLAVFESVMDVLNMTTYPYVSYRVIRTLQQIHLPVIVFNLKFLIEMYAFWNYKDYIKIGPCNFRFESFQFKLELYQFKIAPILIFIHICLLFVAGIAAFYYYYPNNVVHLYWGLYYLER